MKDEKWKVIFNIEKMPKFSVFNFYFLISKKFETFNASRCTWSPPVAFTYRMTWLSELPILRYVVHRQTCLFYIMTLLKFYFIYKIVAIFKFPSLRFISICIICKLLRMYNFTNIYTQSSNTRLNNYRAILEFNKLA